MKPWQNTIIVVVVCLVLMGALLYKIAKNKGWLDGPSCEEAYKSAVASGYLGFYCLTSDRNADYCTNELKERARVNLNTAINQCRVAKRKYPKCEDEYEEWLSCLAKGPREKIECEEEENAKEYCINRNYRL